MAWVTKNSQETYTPEPPPREYTRQEKAANWWHYQKWAVLVVVIVLALIAWTLHDALSRVEPDVTIGYVGRTSLPTETAEALQDALVPYCTDLNGDGKVTVQLTQFTVDFGASLNDTDMYNQMAGTTQLSAELSGLSTIYLWLLEDPAGFEEQCGVLEYPDGTMPPEGTATDWQRMVYRWADCPALTALDLGQYTGLDGTTGDSQDLLAGLYLGRRGTWEEETPAAYTDTAPLWQALTAGAAPVQ